MNTQWTIITEFPYYAEEVRKLYSYLNGKVNPHNPCVLNIAHFSNNNYAQFQSPNLMTVFLGSIIQSSLELATTNPSNPVRDYVLSIVVLTTVHELTHAEQCINPAKYKADAKYATMIEDSAEYNAEIFCVGHKQTFKELFNFNFIVTSKTPPTACPQWNMRDHVLNAVYGVFRCKPIVEQLQSLLDEETGDVAMVIKPRNTDGSKAVHFPVNQAFIPIRRDGVILADKDALDWFNSKLMEYRNVIIAYSYNFLLHSAIYKNKANPDLEYFTVVIEVESRSYEPFLFT